jgi:hypothetical protein
LRGSEADHRRSPVISAQERWPDLARETQKGAVREMELHPRQARDAGPKRNAGEAFRTRHMLAPGGIKLPPEHIKGDAVQLAELGMGKAAAFKGGQQQRPVMLCFHAPKLGRWVEEGNMGFAVCIW